MNAPATGQLPVVVIGAGPVGLVELTLPETGVCGGAGLYDAPDTAVRGGEGGCCGAPSTLQIGIVTPAATSGGC